MKIIADLDITNLTRLANKIVKQLEYSFEYIYYGELFEKGDKVEDYFDVNTCNLRELWSMMGYKGHNEFIKIVCNRELSSNDIKDLGQIANFTSNTKFRLKLTKIVLERFPHILRSHEPIDLGEEFYVKLFELYDEYCGFDEILNSLDIFLYRDSSTNAFINKYVTADNSPLIYAKIKDPLIYEKIKTLSYRDNHLKILEKMYELDIDIECDEMSCEFYIGTNKPIPQSAITILKDMCSNKITTNSHIFEYLIQLYQENYFFEQLSINDINHIVYYAVIHNKQTMYEFFYNLGGRFKIDKHLGWNQNINDQFLDLLLSDHDTKEHIKQVDKSIFNSDRLIQINDAFKRINDLYCDDTYILERSTPLFFVKEKWPKSYDELDIHHSITTFSDCKNEFDWIKYIETNEFMTKIIIDKDEYLYTIINKFLAEFKSRPMYDTFVTKAMVLADDREKMFRRVYDRLHELYPKK